MVNMRCYNKMPIQEQKIQLLTRDKQEKKCHCVPSGMCHSHSMIGCPHPHYFDEKGVWKCVLPTNDFEKFDDVKQSNMS
jgi:hypothetical protein